VGPPIATYGQNMEPRVRGGAPRAASRAGNGRPAASRGGDAVVVRSHQKRLGTTIRIGALDDAGEAPRGDQLEERERRPVREREPPDAHRLILRRVEPVGESADIAGERWRVRSREFASGEMLRARPVNVSEFRKGDQATTDQDRRSALAGQSRKHLRRVRKRVATERCEECAELFGRGGRHRQNASAPPVRSTSSADHP
jgi:hypothetical protein